MSKLIRQLLGEVDPLFSVGIARIEQASGRPGIDARLTADIQSAVRLKLGALGMDPNDTTGQELYAAISAKVVESESYLLSFLGHPANFDGGYDVLCNLLATLVPNKEIWTTKHTSLKKIIKANPPKNVMKAFHFQSVDSLLKRLDTAECMLAARVVETKTWWSKTKKLLSALSAKDFEMNSPKVTMLNSTYWLPLTSRWRERAGHSVILSKECGVVGVGLTPGNAPYLTTLMYALHGLNEVSIYGTYLKLHFVNPSIGNVLVHALDDGDLIHTSVSGTRFHWRDIQRYFGLYAQEASVQFVHLDINDLGWLDCELQLSVLVPELSFWLGTDYSGVVYGEKQLISLNILDAALSVHDGRDYKNMYTAKLRRALRSELMARYVAIPVSRALVLKQFDISDIVSEDW